MSGELNMSGIDILLVEDSPGDVRLAQEVFKEAKIANRLHVVNDGVEALAFLRQEGAYKEARRPDLILLDLNLPKMDGREVLTEIKHDPDFQNIPVVVLTISSAEEDVHEAYHSSANCYIVKPIDLDQFTRVVRAIEDFWLAIVKLPPEP